MDAAAATPTGRLMTIQLREASSIMGSDLLSKLKYQGGRALIVNAPEGYSLSAENSGGAEGDYPFIQIFVSSAEDARAQIPHWLAALETHGILWVTYPKQRFRHKS